MNRKGIRDPNIRFERCTVWGPPSSYRPDLGPCLIFTGADNGNGYGQFNYNQKNSYIHRFAWERAHGPIPAGMTVDHLCRVRRCCNVDHLELTDRVDNFLRGVEARKAICQNGHERTPENTGSRRGKRDCLDCRRATWRRAYAKTREGKEGQNRSIKYDQNLIRSELDQLLIGETTIAASARRVGCNPNYLGRRAWEEARRRALARDGGLCVNCTREATDVHHRFPRGHGGSANPKTSFGLANLISLCRQCHVHVESNRSRAFELGLLVRMNHDPATVPVKLQRRWVLLTPDGGYRDTTDPELPSSP